VVDASGGHAREVGELACVLATACDANDVARWLPPRIIWARYPVTQ
jgi:hypothetical protein